MRRLVSHVPWSCKATCTCRVAITCFSAAVDLKLHHKYSLPYHLSCMLSSSYMPQHQVLIHLPSLQQEELSVAFWCQQNNRSFFVMSDQSDEASAHMAMHAVADAAVLYLQQKADAKRADNV